MEFKVASPEFSAVSWLFDQWLSRYKSGSITLHEARGLMVDHVLQQIPPDYVSQRRIKRPAIIVAYDEERGVGKNNSIPWRIDEDMEHFKSMTMGCPVVMGRKTWDSLPKKFRPLPGRLNLIVSRGKPDIENFPDTLVLPSISDAIKVGSLAVTGDKRVWIAGGGEIYRQALQNTMFEVFATEVKGTHDCDTFFPKFEHPEWWVRKVIREDEKFNVVHYRSA